MLLQVILAHSFSLPVFTSWCELTELFILIPMNTEGFPECFSITHITVMNIPVHGSRVFMHFFFFPRGYVPKSGTAGTKGVFHFG